MPYKDEDKKKSYYASYYAAHREEAKERAGRWKAAHPEKAAETERLYRETHQGNHTREHAGGRGLIVAPPGVRQEFKRDALEKLGWKEAPQLIRSNIAIGFWFTVVSLGRSYLLRRAFNHVEAGVRPEEGRR